MTGWSHAALGEIARVVSGTTPPTFDETNYGGGVVWVTPVDLGKLRQATIEGSGRTITEAARLQSGMELLPPGTVVMSSRAPIGYLGVAGVPFCTNQGCKSFVPSRQIDSWFLYYALRFRMPSIRSLGAGATFPEVSRADLEKFEVAFPSRREQESIATRLSNQFGLVSRASGSAVAQTRAARELGLRVITQAFRDAAREWRIRRIGDLTESRRSPSVRADGDTAVATITSGSLTPFGFSFDGIRAGRMSATDAIAGVVTANEVLVSRSNTEALVGRASRYPGGRGDLVASDLVFRLVPDPMSLVPDYLAGYLSVLQLDGYWRDRSSGASSTMKKITKSLLLDVEIALPPLAEQLRIVEELHERMTSINGLEAALLEEQRTIYALPAAMLRRAFEDAA
jgi:type I restriction enzyme S subunit